MVGNKYGIDAVVINEKEPVDRKRVEQGYLRSHAYWLKAAVVIGFGQI